MKKFVDSMAVKSQYGTLLRNTFDVNSELIWECYRNDLGRGKFLIKTQNIPEEFIIYEWISNSFPEYITKTEIIHRILHDCKTLNSKEDIKEFFIRICPYGMKEIVDSEEPMQEFVFMSYAFMKWERGVDYKRQFSIGEMIRFIYEGKHK